MTGPTKNQEYYQPLEFPRRYPLELRDDGHVCLWSDDNTYKWTVAYFERAREGYSLRFVGERPLDARVNWTHFREIVEQGYAAFGRLFRDEEGGGVCTT